jgi:hypothetical protein
MFACARSRTGNRSSPCSRRRAVAEVRHDPEVARRLGHVEPRSRPEPLSSPVLVPELLELVELPPVDAAGAVVTSGIEPNPV